jgi:hypothetical protein
MEKKSVGLLELEMAVLECFLEKTPLSPLGVKIYKLWNLYQFVKNICHLKESLDFHYYHRQNFVHWSTLGAKSHK